MFGCETVAAITGGKLFALIEQHLQRREVWIDQNVRGNDFGLQFGMFALMTRILVAAHVVPGPSVEPVFLHVSHVIRNEVVAQTVAFVGGAPKLPGGRVDGLADAVANSGCVYLDEFAVWSVLEHVGAVELQGMRINVIDI